METVLPRGGIAAGAVNLAGSSIGAGILALPLAFKRTGIVIASGMLAFVTILTIFSVYLLGLVAKKINVENYDEIGNSLTGRWGNYFLSAVQWFNGIGSCIAYVTCIDGLIQAFQKNAVGWWASNQCRRIFLSLVWLCGMLPISMPKEINTIRYIAFFCVGFIFWFVFCVILHSAQNGLTSSNPPERKLFVGNKNLISGLSMIIFAYLCQPNVLEVYTESRPKTVSRLTWAGGISMSFCGFVYWCIGFFAYMDAGEGVEDNVMKQYPPLEDYKFLVAYCGMVVKICVAFALHLFPCRDSFYQLLGWKLLEVPYWKNILLCGSICVVSLLVGMFFPNIEILFGLLGALCGSTLGFIFPAIFLMYAGNFSRKETGKVLWVLTYVLLYIGIASAVFGTALSIEEAIVKIARIGKS